MENIENRLEALENAVKNAGLAQKSVLTLREAAAFCGMSTSTMYKFTFNHTVPHSKPNGKFIFFDQPIQFLDLLYFQMLYEQYGIA